MNKNVYYNLLMNELRINKLLKWGSLIKWKRKFYKIIHG